MRYVVAIVAVFMFALGGYFIAISCSTERNNGEKKTDIFGTMEKDERYHPPEKETDDE